MTAGDGAIIAQWADTQGAERYEVYLRAGTDPPAEPLRTVSGTSALLDGLVNKTVYSVWIKAVNSAGSSELSPPARARPWSVTEVPETPARPQVVGGVYQLTVSWDASGGAASYEVYYSTANTQPAAPAVSATGTRAVLTGLANETLYYVWVRGVNAAGRSGYSQAEIGMPRTPTAPPAAPEKPALAAGNRELAVSWEPVEMASAYEVWAGTSSNSASATKRGADITGGLTQAALTGLVNETAYYVWIKAKNVAGASGFSPAASAAPSALAGPPRVPAAPAVTAGSRALFVSWQAAEGAESYEVWAGTSSNPASAVKQGEDTTALSATVTNLVNGTAYYVWIQAKNRTGTSGFSPATSGTPTALASPPSAPAAPTVTPGNGQLFVNWRAVEDAESYEVWAGTSGNSADAAKRGADISGLSTALTGLVKGTAYYVWIKAKNSAGTSGFSPAASGTPRTITAGLYKGEAFTTATKIGSQNLELALSYIAANALSGDNYYIVLGANETIALKTLYFYSGEPVGITLMSDGVERTVQLASNGSLFTVNSGVTLTLENNVTLKGMPDNTASLITIYDDSSTFIMNGGEISGNTSCYGGGVSVALGTFTMSGGKISGNTAEYEYADGGGVNLLDSTFTMSGGKISGNTSSSSSSSRGGGGVYFSGSTFTMSGGTISGNTASNFSSGGGVYVYHNGTFTKAGTGG